jgi:hypothetical protein
LTAIILGILGSLAASPAWAKGLSAGIRIQQELFKPRAPSQRKLYTCFKADPNGVFVMGVCAQESTDEELNRAPAMAAPPPPSLQKKKTKPRAPASIREPTPRANPSRGSSRPRSR